MTIPFCSVWASVVLGGLLSEICIQILYLRHDVISEEFFYVCGGDGVEIAVEGNAYALLAFAHAESTAESYFVSNVILADQTLELFYDLTGTLNVAGTADAHC